MKRNALWAFCILVLLGSASVLLADDSSSAAPAVGLEPTADPARAVVETEAIADPEILSDAEQVAGLEVDPFAELFWQDSHASNGLVSITCLCVCAGPIWSIEDVRTTGTCDELVGQACWSWGPGVYTSCLPDGGPLPI